MSDPRETRQTFRQLPGSALRVLAVLIALFAAVATDAAADDPPVSLRGSPAAMQQQHRVAVEHDLDFFRTEQEIRDAISRGELVELHGSEVYEVAGFVDLPYVHPAARLFITRTAALYYEACGEPLVVTSGVRAISQQPPNAHALSVHPAGMAVDLRVSQQEACREWLESKMTSLEEMRVINGIREFRPPHYHVAVFPAQYTAFVAEQLAAEGPMDADEILPTATTEGNRAAWFAFGVLGTVLAAALIVMLRRNRFHTPAV